MEQLEYFIGVVIPATILVLVALGMITTSIGGWYQRYMWNKINSMCDEMDAYHHDIIKWQNQEERVDDAYGDQDFVANLLIESFRREITVPTKFMGGYYARDQRYIA